MFYISTRIVLLFWGDASLTTAKHIYIESFLRSQQFYVVAPTFLINLIIKKYTDSSTTMKSLVIARGQHQQPPLPPQARRG